MVCHVTISDLLPLSFTCRPRLQVLDAWSYGSSCSRFAPTFLFCFFMLCAAGVTRGGAGHCLLLMSASVAVLGSVVFVQDTWFPN